MTEISKKRVREYVQRFKRDTQTENQEVISGEAEEDDLIVAVVNDLLKLSLDISLIADENLMLEKVIDILDIIHPDHDERIIARILILIGLMPT